MPVVHIRALEQDTAAGARDLSTVARAVADATPCPLESVWVTLQGLTAQTLGDRVVAGEGRIAYVDLWMRPRESDLDAPSRSLTAACEATAVVLGIPREDVWGALHAVEPGRVYAGGGIVGS